MANPKKYFENGGLYFLTSRTEEGLPFRDIALFSELLVAIIARALLLYPVELVAFTLEINHIHCMLCALNPEHVPLFMGYIKQELSHAVNRLRGRKKKTIWCEGYDSPILLGKEEAFYYLTYIYNQSRSSRTILCNSWDMLVTGNYEKECKRRHRTAVKEDSEETLKLTLTPFCWLKRLCPDLSEGEARKKLIEKVREARRVGGVTPFVPVKLSKELLDKDETYIPKKHGQRTYCICWNIEIRKKFLAFIKYSLGLCGEVLSQWRKGEYHVPWPPGFFPPSAIRRANCYAT